jgi:hypothetical protein
VETWSKDPESARATVDTVLNAAPDRLIAIQERVGAPRQSYFTAFVTLPTQVEELPGTSTLKLLIALTGVGVLAGAALSLVVDRLITSARVRRAALPPRVVAWDEPVGASPPAVGANPPAVGADPPAVGANPPAVAANPPAVEHAHQQRSDPVRRTPVALDLVNDDEVLADRLMHERFWEQDTPILYLNGANLDVSDQHVSNGRRPDLEPKLGSDSS